MGKMPVIWHHRFGIQGLKAVTTASCSNPAFVAQSANTYHFQVHTREVCPFPLSCSSPLQYGTSLALSMGGSIATEWLLFHSEECHDM